MRARTSRRSRSSSPGSSRSITTRACIPAGGLRDGEVDALGAVLDAVSLDPPSYAFLADRDEKIDPKKFEVDLLRDRLAHVEVLRTFAADVQYPPQHVTLCSEEMVGSRHTSGVARRAPGVVSP